MHSPGEESVLYAEECYRIQGAIFEVYHEIGAGFLESVYQECLEMEFRRCGIPFVAQRELDIRYKGEALNQTFRADLVCFGSIIIELKAVREIASEHEAQILNYLRATGLRLGLLVNFCSHPKVTIRRFVL